MQIHKPDSTSPKALRVVVGLVCHHPYTQRDYTSRRSFGSGPPPIQWRWRLPSGGSSCPSVAEVDGRRSAGAPRCVSPTESSVTAGQCSGCRQQTTRPASADPHHLTLGLITAVPYEWCTGAVLSIGDVYPIIITL